MRARAGGCKGPGYEATPGCAPALLCSVAPRSVHLAVLLTMAALLFLVGLHTPRDHILSFVVWTSCTKSGNKNEPPARMLLHTTYRTPDGKLLFNLWWPKPFFTGASRRLTLTYRYSRYYPCPVPSENSFIRSFHS